jgi:tetratricopeptide (TPR) repeat protein
VGDTEGALPYYRESLEVESSTTDYKSCMGLGIGLLRLGRPEEAQPYLARCAELCQERIGATTKLHPLISAKAMVLLALGRTREGLAALREGLSRSLSEHHRQYALEDLFLLGRAAPSLQGLEEALEILEGR